MLAQLGDIAFAVVGPVVGLAGERSYGYAAHELVREKPRLQAVGDALERLTLTLALRLPLNDPEADLRALHRAAEAHAALPFLLGTGEVLGRYVIERVQREAEETDDVGRLVSARVRVELIEWVADRPLTGSTTDALDRDAAVPIDADAPTVGDVRTPWMELPPPAGDFHGIAIGEVTRIAEMEGTAGVLRRVGRGVGQYIEVRTRDGERWDQLAARYLGNAFGYGALVAANPDLPITPTLPSGLALRVPVAGDAGAGGVLQPAPASLAAGMPPWKLGPGAAE